MLVANAGALVAWKDITPLAGNGFICWVEDARSWRRGSAGRAAGRAAPTLGRLSRWAADCPSERRFGVIRCRFAGVDTTTRLRLAAHSGEVVDAVQVPAHRAFCDAQATPHLAVVLSGRAKRKNPQPHVVTGRRGRVREVFTVRGVAPSRLGAARPTGSTRDLARSRPISAVPACRSGADHGLVARHRTGPPVARATLSSPHGKVPRKPRAVRGIGHARR